ncbi:DNA repair protein REV1 isoform X6 [Alligator sinensis]|uniref:DNA repair protein REV1 n=1 Tax=Alligator sinensis TaxID=38654 RepID=A0A3Q0GU92_ALLSI|nr:DNA repair protein REV1 isoform X6 [Alligator sinensis]
MIKSSSFGCLQEKEMENHRAFSMRRGGWRKRAGDHDGWGTWGGYMSAKVKKLEDQFCADAVIQQQKDGTSTGIFSGVAIYVNGFTDPSADELRRLMMLHGGQYHVYYSRSKTTHIIATNLPNAKIKELKGEKVVRPEWIIESIKAGHLLSHVPYQLYTKQSSVQKGLNFNTICKPEDAMPGPSNIAKELNNRVNHLIKKCETENDIKGNGIDSWNEEEEEDSKDLGIVELEQVFPVRTHNGVQHYRDSTAIFNGHTLNSTSALKTQDCLVPSGNSVVSRFSPGPLQEEGKTEKGIIDFRDCTMQQLQQSNKNTDLLWNPHRTMSNSFSSSSLHSNTKLNGAHHSTVQGPSSTKSTSSVPTPSKAASSPVSKPSDCNFISDFYSRSRLHHISTWKSELTEFVNNLQRKNNGVFPGSEKLKKLKTGRSALKTDTGNVSVLNSAKPQSCIMHVDMDCFFVSVGIRNRPDLKGKPVAVTSNRGAGRASLRPGANPQLEWQYYQNKILNGKTAENRVPDKLDSTWGHQDSAQMNGADSDLSVLSMAEIASCSYEARQAGIKNGMFFGQAKKLCPNLQAVPYDFNAYKEVARTLYEMLASYTHNIEAVSCDEALVDITEILTETRLTPDEFANTIRTEIKAQTKCAASVGMGSNILLARMATRKAKPDGQYYLKPEEVDDFIRGQLVTSLPGVGRTMESKLASLGIKTCGDLQYVSMAKLQKEFGPKTGQMLYRFCRGLDDRPVRTEKERKSVSAEINYGIRFTQPKEAEAFLLSLSEEIQRRLEAAGMKGKRLTLKIMVRKAGAPVEPAKYGGHGICDNIARTVTLDHATDSAKVIGKETLNMFHTMKLNISDMRGLDKSVLEALPPDLREQVEQIYTIQQGEIYGDSKKEPINGCNTGLLPQPIGAVLLQIPELQEPDSDVGINVIALPAFSQVDPEVFAALPAELQAELKDAYDQRQKQSENMIYQQLPGTFASKNPLLQLKQATVKTKKKTRKKNAVSPMKKIQSPLKNKLLGSPAKNTVATSGSPQKLMDGFLKQEGTVTGKPQVEPVPSTSDNPGPSDLKTKPSVSFRSQAPNLAGAVEFNDVKTLLKEWITTISDPMEEDILQVVKYCTDLIEEKDLEQLDLVIKYMKRLMQSSVESVWNMAFDFILDNVQVVLQQTYGSTLKVI